MDLQDLRAGVLRGVRELDLAVEAAGPHERRVEDVGAVGRGDDLDLLRAAEPVELVEELEHRALHLAVAADVRVEPLGANGVDLVDEDDRRGLLLREQEGVPHQLGAVPDEHLHQLRARELEERGVGLRRAGAGDERLAGPRGAVQQDALGRLDPEGAELVLVRDGEDDRLHELLDLLVQPANVRVVLRWLLVHLHGLHPGVVLRRERVEDEVAVLVDSHQVARLKRLRVHQPHHWEEYRLPRGGLQHNALPLALAVEVHIGAILLLVLVRGDVQHLHDIANKVRELVVQLYLLLVLLNLLPHASLVKGKPGTFSLEDPDLIVQEACTAYDVVS
mmetsp:Transcript_31688/g.75269  ORF Transcript_31688/g.75269 Transcript_31688/m.75269 type:complete len:334 (+) Transcript_31688:294-1295(+)